MAKCVRTLKESAPDEDAVPREIKLNGKVITSPKELADKYATFLEEKHDHLRESTKYTNFKAMNIFRMLIKRIDEPIVFEPVSLSEIKKISKL